MRVLTDEVPTLFSVILMEISAGYKAKPKGWCYAIGEHGVISKLLLSGDHSVSGGGLL